MYGNNGMFLGVIWVSCSFDRIVTSFSLSTHQRVITSIFLSLSHQPCFNVTNFRLWLFLLFVCSVFYLCPSVSGLFFSKFSEWMLGLCSLQPSFPSTPCWLHPENPFSVFYQWAQSIPPSHKCYDWLFSKQPVMNLSWNSLIKLETRRMSPTPSRHHSGENEWALGRSAKATRLLGQLGTFTGNHESITILLNHISLLPKGKLWRAQQASFLLASGIKFKLWGEEQLRPCRTGGLHTGAAGLMKWPGRKPRLLDELFKTLPFESYSPDSISNEAPLS